MAKTLKPEPCDLDAARATLSDPDADLTQLTDGQWLALAEQLAAETEIDGLKAIESRLASRKPLIKALKRIYHKLRSKGIDVEAARKGVYSVGSAGPPPPMAAVSVGTIDGMFFITGLASFADGTSVIVYGKSGETLEVIPVPRSEARRYVASQLDQRLDDGTPYFTEVPFDYLLDLVQHIARQRREVPGGLNDVPPEFFARVGRVIGDEDGVHPANVYLAERGVEPAASLGTSGDISYGLELLVPAPEWTQALVGQAVEVQESRLVLSQGSKLERIGGIIAALVDEMVDDVGRGEVAFAMRHNAYIASLQGREVDAGIFLKVAQVLETSEEPASTIPLLCMPFEKVYQDLVGRRPDLDEEAEPPKSPIITL